VYQPLRGIARAKRLNTGMICEKPVSRSPTRLLFFFSTFTMTDDAVRSVGQGNLYSRVIPHRPSIVTGLHTRSLTGRRLNLHVHQHLVYRLHLVWKSAKKGVTTEGYRKEILRIWRCEIILHRSH
jgi:hypothetical protein